MCVYIVCTATSLLVTSLLSFSTKSVTMENSRSSIYLNALEYGESTACICQLVR